jgi:GMP synthase (glutamine-hydrolysing)
LGQAIPRKIDDYDGLIVLGGPQGVYDEHRFPFLGPEKELTHNALQANRPILGVCLGSQILAEVLGARVVCGRNFEVGWKKVTISEGIKDDFVLGNLPREIMPLHWHGDTYDLPEGTKAIGSSELTPVQGFSRDGITYGFLFHLEITIEQLRAMVEEFPADVARGGMIPDEILADALKHLAALREPSLGLFHRWTMLL